LFGRRLLSIISNIGRGKQICQERQIRQLIGTIENKDNTNAGSIPSKDAKPFYRNLLKSINDLISLLISCGNHISQSYSIFFKKAPHLTGALVSTKPPKSAGYFKLFPDRS
jgi:hypothetical protein